MTATFTPDPRPASLGAMIGAQARMEVRLTLRRGESVLLTLIIPIVILIAATKVDVVHLPSPRVAFVVPGVMALAVFSSAFTGLAIATGFERSYGVLTRLGVSALSRVGLIAGKASAVVVVEVVQLAVLAGVGLALGWSPTVNPVVLVLIVLATIAYASLGMLMAGTLRAEATLAAANLVWFLLLVISGVMYPLDKYGHAGERLILLTPLAPLVDGLRDGFGAHTGHLTQDLLVLTVWAAIGLAAAARSFRWD